MQIFESVPGNCVSYFAIKNEVTYILNLTQNTGSDTQNTESRRERKGEKTRKKLEFSSNKYHSGRIYNCTFSKLIS